MRVFGFLLSSTIGLLLNGKAEIRGREIKNNYKYNKMVNVKIMVKIDKKK